MVTFYRQLGLTRKQARLCVQLLNIPGAPYKTWARHHGISEGTVKRHVNNICKKLGYSCRVELVSFETVRLRDAYPDWQPSR